MNIRWLLTVLCIFSIHSIKSVFFELEGMNSNDNYPLFFVSDEHTGTNKENFGKKQRRAFVKILKQHKAFVIAEDPADDIPTFSILADIDGDISLGNILVDSKKAKIECAPNVDYRDLVTCSLEGEQITAKQALERFYKTIAEIETYKQNPILDAYYRETTAKVLKKNEELLKKLNDSQTKTLQQIANGIKDRKERARFSKNVEFFDSEIIDVKLIHQIYTNRHRSPIFVFAGGNHIRRIIQVLERIDYKTFNLVGKEPKYLGDQETIRASSIVEMKEIEEAVAKRMAAKIGPDVLPVVAAIPLPAAAIPLPAPVAPVPAPAVPLSAADRIRQSLAHFAQ